MSREHSPWYRGQQRKGRIRQLLAKHRGLCALCSCSVTLKHEGEPTYATIDHVLPLSRGGQDVPNNWQLACKSCNNAKGNALPAEAP